MNLEEHREAHRQLREELAQTRAAAGAMLLDMAEPGWWKVIDLDRLDQGYGIFSLQGNDSQECGCILSQLDAHADGLRGTFVKGAGELARIIDEAFAVKHPVSGGELWEITHGFLAKSEADYARLDKAWTDEVTIRRRHDGEM